MNKKALALSLCAIGACAVMLSSCGEVTTSFSAFWYKNTILTTISDTTERLTYKIEYDKGSNTSVNVDYTDGVYTTTLKNGTYTYTDGEVIDVYVYTTEMSVNVTYTVGSEKYEYRDSVISSVKFKGVSDRLCPIESEKAVVSHMPYTSAVESENDIMSYSYTMKTVYDKALTSGVMTISDGENSEEYSFNIDDKYTYLDNEELLFAVRGMSMGSNASENVLSYNTSAKSVQTINIQNASVSELTPEFTVGEDKKAPSGKINYNEVTIAINSNRAGVAQTSYYAATGDATNNTYRNVMILNKVTLPYGIGTLTYTLENAVFTTK